MTAPLQAIAVIDAHRIAAIFSGTAPAVAAFELDGSTLEFVRPDYSAGVLELRPKPPLVEGRPYVLKYGNQTLIFNAPVMTCRNCDDD